MMSLLRKSPYELNLNAFSAIGRDWMLITAEKDDGSINTMTASWGMMGELWGLPAVTVFIRPQRYTREFVDSNVCFTLSFFDGQKKALGLLGSRSGRDCDKISEAGLHPVSIDGQPGFAEARLTLICRKLYTSRLEPEQFLDAGIARKHYPEQDYHYVYVAQVLDAWEKTAE